MANDNFDLPRPADAVPSATSTVLNDNSKVLDYVINSTGIVATRTGKEILTLDEAIARINWAYVGLFADGVTFTAKTDFAVDAVGTQWVYNGPYPLTATAGTIPSSPDYQAIRVNSLQQLDGLGDPSDLAQRHRIKTTIAEIESGVFTTVPAYFEITDRENAKAKLVTGGTPDGFGVISAGGVNTVEIEIDSETNLQHWGAVGDGVANDTAAMSSYFNSGKENLLAGDGKTYLHDSIVISNSAARSLDCNGRCTFLTRALSSAIGVSITPRQYIAVDNIFFKSTGTSGDLLNTIGLDLQEGCSLVETGRGLQFQGYSFRGMRVTQCVAANFKQFTGNCGGYTLSLEKSPGGTPCTTVTIEQPYILGGLRGIWSEGCVGLHIIDPKFEGCGSSVSNDAALHIEGGTAVVENRYFEANNRDIITSDANVLWLGEAFKAGAVAADIYAYSGIPLADRAQGRIIDKELSIRSIQPDDSVGVDLQIGTNLVIPVAGGSAQFGFNTTSKTDGTLSAVSTFETIAALSGQSGTVESQKTYRYAVSVGFADLPTGFDSGVILGGVIYSDTGATPSWLQMSGANLQAQSVSGSYGLKWGLILNDTLATG